jgi:long-chain fatty acid transport protein
MTNTNYHIAFDRMMARGASTEIDAAFSNPAGLVWGYEGFQMSLDFQKPWQNRDITVDVPGFLGQGLNKKYEGKASAPIVPALFASYKKDKWALSAMIGIVGSGGFVKYDDGVPMFNVPIMAMLAQQGVMPGKYTLDSEMKGKQYIYGGQLNFSYRILEHFSLAAGLRANYYDGYYRGHVKADMGPMSLVNLQLDCTQRGWGFTPVVSANYHNGPLTLSARYEFRTKIATTNDTKELVVGKAGQNTDVVALANQIGNDKTVTALSGQLGSMAGKIRGYLPDEETRYDMPALLVVAAGYEFTPKLRATVEYHFFDDKNAKMADNRQEKLSGGTHEIQLGAEYDINKLLTVSLGGQRTDYGLSDEYQQNTSFACDSYSIGVGCALNLTEKLRLNAGYFITLYSDYNKPTAKGDPTKGGGYYGTGYAATETYSRTNNVIGLGIDYKF